MTKTAKQFCKVEGCLNPGITGAHPKSLQRHMAEHHQEVKRLGGRPRLPQKRSKEELNKMNAFRVNTWEKKMAFERAKNKVQAKK